MRSFLTRYEPQVKGVLSGFDRIRFRGTIRWLSSLQGMGTWLSRTGVLLKACEIVEEVKPVTPVNQLQSHKMHIMT